MITCAKLDDSAPAIAYLRRNMLANQCLIESIENNMPPLPREVWVANHQDGAAIGVMVVEDYSDAVQGGGLSPAIRADSSEALSALLRRLNPAETYGFSVPACFRETLLVELSDAIGFSETVSMVLAPEHLHLFNSQGEVRRLSAADKELAVQFPDPGREGEPALSRLVEWAVGDPENQVVFGLVMAGEVVSYVQFGVLLDDLWEVGAIRTREEHQRRGFAKAVLSRASSHILREGRTPFYQVHPDNVLSLRTAEAVGYHEVFRLFSCRGRVRPA